MNNTQRQFVDILSAGIRGKTVENKYENTDWDKVLELANKHKVEGIIYIALRKSELIVDLGEERLNILKKKAINTGIEQSKHISGLSIVLSKINEADIPVIVLKGLVVRDFYPQPDQRSMSDADILVHTDDVEKVKEILAEQLDADPDEMTMDTKIAEELDADRLDVVELLMSIEDEFDVEIPDAEIENLKTIGDVVEYIQNNMQ